MRHQIKTYQAIVGGDPIKGNIYATGTKRAATDAGHSYAEPGEEIVIITTNGHTYTYEYVGKLAGVKNK